MIGRMMRFGLPGKRGGLRQHRDTQQEENDEKSPVAANGANHSLRFSFTLSAAT
jgi:hypothetical protein